MNTLPVLLSIPHGGSCIPDEVKDRMSLTRHDLFDDSDAYTFHIYNLGPKAVKVVYTDVARAVVDCNRAPEDLPPENPDGVIKTVTCYSRPIYHKGRDPDVSLTQTLLKRYYKQYHQNICKAIRISSITLALDCHSMAAAGPPISPDAGQERPMFCLGNRHGHSCDVETVEKFAECIRKAFSLSESDVTINQPFPGGYITQTYGMKPLPWIQIEMNRALYLDSRWFNRAKLDINNERLHELNRMFEESLRRYFSNH